MAGIGSNVELAERVRARGVLPTFSPTAISKWSPNGVQPSVETLREIALVVGVMPIELFIRAEVVLPEDLGQRPVPPMYRDLLDLDREIDHYASRPSALADTFDEERTRLQDHVIGLVHLTRDKVRGLAEMAKIAPPARRRSSTRSKDSG
jgi:transcriptional regulator with XRE-family HTH domain